MLENCWNSIECLEKILAGSDIVIFGLFALWGALLAMWLIVGVRVRKLKRLSSRKWDRTSD